MNRKFFIIINGLETVIIQRESLKDAVTFAQNFSDHSKEVLVREIDISILLGAIGALFSNLKNRFKEWK